MDSVFQIRAHISVRSQRTRDKWLTVGPIGIPKHRQSSTFIQWHLSALLTPTPYPKPLQPRALFPFPQLLFPIEPCHFGNWLLWFSWSTCLLLYFLPLLFSPPPIRSSPTPHPFPPIRLNSDVFQILLVVLSIIAIIESSSTIAWSSPVQISFNQMQILN